MKSINALDLAKYIINKCTSEGKPISNLQLQKILYYIQVDFLKKHKAPLFPEEIEAWQFGPVVPEVYGHYCGFGSLRIRVEYDDCTLTINNKKMLDDIINEKRVKPPWELVEDTHTNDKAWSKIYKDGLGNRKIIPTELMLACG